MTGCPRDRAGLAGRPASGRAGPLATGGTAADRGPGGVPSAVPGPPGPGAAREQRIGDVVDAEQVAHPQHRTRPHPGPGHGVRASPGDPDRLRGPGTDQPAPSRGGTQPSRGGVPPRLRRLAAVEASRGSYDGRSRRSNGAPDIRLANDRSNNSPTDPPSTPMSSTAGGNHRPAPVQQWPARAVLRRQKRRDAPRRAAPGHRRRGRQDPPETDQSPLEGREAERKRMAEVGTVFDSTTAPPVPAVGRTARRRSGATRIGGCGCGR